MTQRIRALAAVSNSRVVFRPSSDGGRPPSPRTSSLLASVKAMKLISTRTVVIQSAGTTDEGVDVDATLGSVIVNR